MKRHQIFAALFGAALFACLGMQLTQPAPASSINGKTICTTTPITGGALYFNGSQWCDDLGWQGLSISNTITFNTAASIPTYEVILIGGGGGGASSTGAGFGGNGSPPGVEICNVVGAGQAYVATIGAGGNQGSAGANGSNGGASLLKIGASSTNCSAFGGVGGTAGTASNGAGGASPGSADQLAMLDASNNVLGLSFRVQALPAGNNAGATPLAAYGVAAGLGCAGANCTSDTAGQGGKIIFIPRP